VATKADRHVNQCGGIHDTEERRLPGLDLDFGAAAFGVGGRLAGWEGGFGAQLAGNAGARGQHVGCGGHGAGGECLVDLLLCCGLQGFVQVRLDLVWFEVKELRG